MNINSLRRAFAAGISAFVWPFVCNMNDLAGLSNTALFKVSENFLLLKLMPFSAISNISSTNRRKNALGQVGFLSPPYTEMTKRLRFVSSKNPHKNQRENDVLLKI